MNLWKMELIQLFRGWRGWTLATLYLLGSILAIVIGVFTDRADGNNALGYDRAIEFFMLCSVPASFLFIGLVVSSLSFDSNKDLSIFLRLRFSIKRILITKIVTYTVLSEVLFLFSFGLTFLFASILFDTSNSISFTWLLWGFFFHIINGIFYVCLITFTSGVFKSTVASILLTLAFIVGVPIVISIAAPIELLIRGLIETTREWADVSYALRIMEWWPTTISDTYEFFTITESEIYVDKIAGAFGEEFELDPWFKRKAFITSLLSAPLMLLYAWRTYSRREM